MAPSISQIVASSYNAVLSEARRGVNNWGNSSALEALERKGFVVRESLGPQISVTIDWQANQGADFLATSSTATSTTATDVLTEAQYDIAELVVPINSTFAQDMKNPSVNQKINVAKALILNAIDTHDDTIEAGLFSTSTDGFLGLQNLVPDSGQPNVGGIDGSSETWWRNGASEYQSDGSDIESVFTTRYIGAAKGTGSKMQPTLMLSGSAAWALFVSTQTPNMRFESQAIKSGAKSIQFMNAEYVFSDAGSDRVYFLNPKAYKLVVSKEYFRHKTEQHEMDAAAMTNQKVYSGLQAVIASASHLAVCDQAD